MATVKTIAQAKWDVCSFKDVNPNGGIYIVNALPGQDFGKEIAQVLDEQTTVAEAELIAHIIKHTPQMLHLVRCLADEHTGRDSMALSYTSPGEWAEEILSSIENRETLIP